jgi:penicillin amidase
MTGTSLAARSAGVLCAAAFTAVLVLICTAGIGTVPALGRTLNPGTGVWTDAGSAALPTDQSLTVPGISSKTTVGFDSSGTVHINAGTDADMFRAIGYVQARERIFQMDLMRRQAAGQLSAIIGESALSSDTFELDVGLVRDAAREWQDMPASSPGRAALIEFSQGVNAAIGQMEHDHTLPMYFKLLGYAPAPWTPMDSILIQYLQTQSLSLDDSPLPYSYLAKGLGIQRFNSLFTAAPQNSQVPWDTGPYQKLPLERLPSTDPAAVVPPGSNGTSAPSAASTPSPAAMVSAAGGVLGRITALPAALPSNAIHTMGNSNEWVLSGKRTASGKAILAADPHLKLTLPSVWVLLSARSPSYDMQGVTLPGLPAVLLGNNQKISWGISNSQHGSTFYYLEKTDPQHPGQYYWDGAWRRMNTVTYLIQVKGQAPVKHVTQLTVHGPVLTEQGVTASMWWAGGLPSDDMDSALALDRASNFAQFRTALSGWRAPAENFAYADQAGNIGIVNAGYAPQVSSGMPWLPMTGTGQSDVTGTVPPAALPVVYNPPSGQAVAANQREVTTAYPYYWGRGQAFFDPGWRASEIVRGLTGQNDITLAQTEQLQTSDTDDLARVLVPQLLSALADQPLDQTEQAAAAQLAHWNYSTGANSVAATIWASFLTTYDNDLMQPLLAAYKVASPPGNGFPSGTAKDIPPIDPLQGLFLNLTASDPSNPLFSPPGQQKRTGTDVLRGAFTQVIRQLAAQHGGNVQSWLYGQEHSVMIASLLGDSTLDAGPYPSGGDGLSINSIISPAQTRDGKTLTGVNIGGASWRYVIDWGTGQAVSSYPGGLSEDPASSWYDNGISNWLDGRYLPLLGTVTAADTRGRLWTLIP